MGKIDWNEQWKQSRLNYTLGQNRVSSPDYWDKLWESPLRLGTADNERLQWIKSKLDVRHEDTILDIGCGPGVLTIPLAHKAKHVTAVDISPIALNCIKKTAIEKDLNNITYINKKWEEIDTAIDADLHDVVITSYALTMLDLKEALYKMNNVAKRAVYIFETAGPKYWHYQELWPRLHGENFFPSPDYIYIVNMLYQMGIYANVETAEYETIQRFLSLDEAVQQWAEKLDVTTPQEIDIVRDYLSKTLNRDDDGLCLKYSQKIVAIWWNKEQISAY